MFCLPVMRVLEEWCHLGRESIIDLAGGKVRRFEFFKGLGSCIPMESGLPEWAFLAAETPSPAS
jgi:hypothetical protein